MSLHGNYHIVTMDGNHAIGRNFVEDLSLLPKRVMTLPVQGPRMPTWEIHPISDGKYKIKTGGSYVGVLPNGYISAFLLEDMLQGEKWKIQPVSHHGENAYIILQEDGERGWSFKEGDYQQLSVDHVICTPSKPPHYMPNMIFKITPA
ncbi:hypothetical protein OH76DRAFT_1477320 [Lentinus brumalis]|uniref:Ricin B lectin domain-containing protein n=1 Tax=Lentinus brumalis TaxID=2498619 RepID=A0A371DW99_9APHY|nr:hypothetical protein OH76DRAFT_1477320 [Polyporus brumalis]